jgi:ATP-dependent Clp protease ATP-binding subunit ClpA
MRNVAEAPCIALEPNRRSADIQSFESELRRRIVGQDHAIDSLVSAFQSVRAGLVPERRPIRNFLFLGPTGSGKTHPSRRLPRYCSEDPRPSLKSIAASSTQSRDLEAD